MRSRQLWFSEPYRVEIRETPLREPAENELLVQSECSAISAGTEMLVYRGQLPTDISLDASLASLQGAATYPLQYGYACVGRVKRLGAAVDAGWLHKRVFSFQPHASHFIAAPDQLLTVPDDIEPEAAVFLANMETAVNLVLDGNPALGEKALVLGQGVVGLLLSGVLARFPLAKLYALDGLAERRASALRLGVSQAFDPANETQIASLKQALRLPVQLPATAGSGADLVYEVSGAPEALNLAIDLCAYSGRIVIGSWYGGKAGAVRLGGAAHRHRIQFIGSQVSTIAPALSGRWDKQRRFDLAWDMIRALRPRRLISHRAVLGQAGNIYRLLDRTPEQALQAIFIY
ncbi:zinc-binding dehydrogenase [Methylomonas sp. SURF-2]|uniref:Zinc-binding dehydrogenase n=1 Tax=Methylomonas subterranea TaxID=2952225 RepID=A0ABT1TN76_9GAMM|nr:zinc-binding dehydrogenase [Methylomonas sp. SURF-2]